MEHIDDTEDFIEDLVSTDTTETQENEPVNFDELLDTAETDDDFAKLGEQLRAETLGDEDGVDTKTDDDKAIAVRDFDIGSGIKIKDGGIELNITDPEQVVRLMQQGLNYAGKTTELAKYRSFVKYAEENNISLDDIQLLRDIKAGNSDAYSKLAKDAGIELYEVTEDQYSNYRPSPVVLNETIEPDAHIDEVANEILANDDYTRQFQQWLPTMPKEIQELVTTDSTVLRGVKQDMESGLFAPAMEQAYKYQRINGLDFNSAYVRAKNELRTINSVTQPSRQQQQEVTVGERRRAATTRSSASPRSSSYGAGVISDMTDADFLANFENIIKSVRN
ncbi:MAG: hypothetical protein JHC33_13035 [Ignisphaera sp.]|nr:hypothetical protein [Ignisphaera sp.]